MLGQTISHYKILEKLGEGGMGVVYKAEDLTLGRTVALKFLPVDTATRDEDRARLIHEARAAAALLHPNICPVHEIAESEGRIFIAMAHIEGRSLKDRIAEGPLPLDEALSIARQIGDGLAAAHAKGIIHRDIKPANVMLTVDGRPILMDFGLAKVAGATKLTRTGTTMGTVAYMSPEQVHGKEVDSRSDIWALGVVLYEMVSGKPPFGGEYEAALMYSILNEDPEPLAGEGKDVPAGFDGIIAKALAKDPAKRYQRAEEFVANVQLLAQDHEALPAGRLRSAKGLRRLWRRWRPWQRAAAVASLMAMGLIAAVLMIRFWPSAPDATKYSLAVMDFRDLATPDDPTVSAGLTELVNMGLIQAELVGVVSSDLLHDLRRRLFGSPRGAIEDSQTMEIARRAEARLFLAGTIGQSGANRFVNWRLVDARNGQNVGMQRAEGSTDADLANQIIAQAMPMIARACGVKAASAPTTMESITTDNPRALQHYMAGVLASEEGRGDDAIAEFERAVAQDSTFALAYLWLGRMYVGFRRGAAYVDKQRGKEYFEKAALFKSRLGIQDRMRLEAELFNQQYRAGEAIAILREMRKRWPDDRETLIDLEGQFYFFGYFPEALKVAEEGLRLYPDDIVIGGPMYLDALVCLGRAEEALRAARAYVKRGPSEPNEWSELGLRYLAVGLPDSAETAFHKAMQLDPDWAPENLSYCAYHRGDLRGAIAGFEKILEQRNLDTIKRRNLITVCLQNLNLAALYIEAGRYQEAHDVAQEYMSVDPCPENPFRVSFLLLAMGRSEEVLDIAEHCPKCRECRVGALAETGDTQAAKEAVRKYEESAVAEGTGSVSANACRLRAKIALAEHNPKTALELLSKMKTFGIPFGGLFDIDYRTTLARAYRMAGRFDEAANVHKEMLRIYGGHVLSHYELGTIYEEMKRPAEAKKEYTKFLEMWSEADKGLPQLIDARKRLAAL
jgi:tetratricopeptide (TPR) repeat protein/predicted Ser/Thr protein kinase